MAEGSSAEQSALDQPAQVRPISSTNIMDFGGFDSSMILILRGGILMSIGDFLEDLSQAILVGITLVGRLGVSRMMRSLGVK